MKKIVSCFLLIFLFISCGNSQEINSVTKSELKALMAKEKIQLLDVRTAAEIKKGFIETAIFADFYMDNFYEKAIKKLDKNKPVYVYCRSGSRSAKTTRILHKKGYKVYNILGGYNKWKQES